MADGTTKAKDQNMKKYYEKEIKMVSDNQRRLVKKYEEGGIKVEGNWRGKGDKRETGSWE